MLLDLQDTMQKRWLRSLRRQHGASVRLFCLPYAGAGTSVFQEWGNFAPDWLELIGVQLPGREDRASEPLISDPDEIVAEITAQLSDYDDLPFALYGHSMGAGLALRVAQALTPRGKASPVHLFVAAHRAPCHPYRYRSVVGRGHDDLPEIVESFGGLSGEAMQNRPFLDFYVPIIRNDLQVCERNRFDPLTQIDCPLTVLIGANDETLSPEEYLGWGRESRAAADYIEIAGDHFFLRSHARDVVAHISRKLHHADASKGKGRLW